MQSKVTELAQACGATPYSPAPMRAVRGLSFTYAQLESFALHLQLERQPCLLQISEPVANNSESPNGCFISAEDRMALHAASGLLRGHGYTDCSAAVMRVAGVVSSWPVREPLAPITVGAIADKAGYAQPESRADFINGLRHGEQAHGITGICCPTCNDNGLIGGPSFHAPDEGGEPCPDCTMPTSAAANEQSLSEFKATLEVLPLEDIKGLATSLFIQQHSADRIQAMLSDAGKLAKLEMELAEARAALATAPANVWQQAVDMELVSAHLGIAGNVTFEQAAKSLHELIRWNIEVATNPATNGGKVLVPAAVAVPELQDMLRELRVQISAITVQLPQSVDCSGVWMAHDKMSAALAAAPAAMLAVDEPEKPRAWEVVNPLIGYWTVVRDEEAAASIQRDHRDGGYGESEVTPLYKRQAAVLHHVADAGKMIEAAAPVVLPEPRWHNPSPHDAAHFPYYTPEDVRALLATATGLPAEAVPDGWREQFAAEVYADLSAADNQDVPLEEYPARILNVLDAIVGPRHPAVVQWRNDAIKSCIAIAYKYCRDPESHKYLKQDLEALLTAEPAPQAQADARDAARYRWLRKSPNPACDIGLAKHFACGRGEDFEALIDAAIAAAKGE